MRASDEVSAADLATTGTARTLAEVLADVVGVERVSVERTFVTIGDDCTLNAGSIIQCHSQEGGSFKSDRITIGTGCTLGVGAFVHYGVTMGDGAVLASDSFS